MTSPPPILHYSPLSEYRAPSERSARAWRRLRSIWRAARAAIRTRGEADDGERDGAGLPARQVPADALPSFEVAAAADALATALDGWPEAESGARRVRAVVGPPGSRVQEVVAELARRAGWREIEPPARSELLERGGVIAERAAQLEAGDGAPAVVCRLERWLLRSESALPSARLMLGALRGGPSPVLVGCDSWAWSFLDGTLGAADLFGEPLALAPFDGEKLARWLGPPMRSRGLTCRPRDNRDEVIFETAPEAGSRVLMKLAAMSRGNAGVALELWSRSLRLAAEEERTVWALPPAESELTLPPWLGPAHHFVLHALLLHGGLDRGTLLAVLPLPRHDVLRRVRELCDAGILIEDGEEGDGGELSVPLSAYVPVRQRLADEGFLIDAF